MKDICLNTRVNIDKWVIIESLLENFNDSEIIEFIKDIDKSMSNWDFTLELINYFKEEEKKYKGEMMEGEMMEEEKKLTAQEWADINAEALVSKNKELLMEMVKQFDEVSRRVDINQEKSHWRKVFISSAIQSGKDAQEAIKIADELINDVYMLHLTEGGL